MKLPAPMVKKRNHYIPRLLLRRFAFRETKKGAYLWQFRREGSPIQLETGNAGVESFFYGDPATGVEDDLGEVETAWKQLLDWIDGGGDLLRRRQELWRFAWILGIRTRAIRAQFTRTVLDLLSRMARVHPETMIMGMLREFERTRETTWNDAVAALPKETAEAVRAAVTADPSVKQRVLEHIRSQLPSAVPPMVQQGFGIVASGALPWAAARGQIEGLAKLLANETGHVDSIAPACWSVLRFQPGAVVLGDGVTFTVGPRREVGTVGCFKSDLEAIYVPVSHDRVLVGHKEGAPTLDLAAINEASACLSHDSLFAWGNSDLEHALASRIGTIEPMISDREMEEIVGDVWRKLGEPRGREGT